MRELLVLCDDLNAKLDKKIRKEIKFFEVRRIYCNSGSGVHAEG
jgi:hypothetical protein